MHNVLERLQFFTFSYKITLILLPTSESISTFKTFLNGSCGGELLFLYNQRKAKLPLDISCQILDLQLREWCSNIEQLTH